jgi:hypothetical protein
MDEYRIDTHELWYYILYPICFIILVLVAWGFEASVVYAIQYAAPSINMNNSLLVHGLATGILVGMVLTIILIIELKINVPWAKLNGFLFLQIISAIALATGLYIAIVNLNTYFYPPRQSTGSKLYEPVKEPFVDGSNINQTLKNVQTVTQALQKSLDTLSTATDDTCFVMKGIERRFLDNATAPEGDGTTLSPAEAKELKAKQLPGAQKQWNQKKPDWSATHGQVSMIECFSDESLSDLIAANQQLTDLLASAPVQKVIAQVKSLQTSATFSQSYIDQLVAKLNGESFDNPTPEDTIATSNKLIAKAKDVQASISKILNSTLKLKKNYTAIDAKSNDPNTVNNLAANNV